jgi:PiT family inorganic phosphate transporter
MPEAGGALLILVVVFALAFDYINGFHDTANAIATVVSTRVLTPLQAIIMAASLNFVGALVATNVASTIAKGIIDTHMATETVILGALIGAIAWNLITWAYGIPSSSSHALIGGLVGAGAAHGGVKAVQWNGVWSKVVIPLVTSPIAGFVVGLILMVVITMLFHKSNPRNAGGVFRNLQRLSAATMAYAHGQNDAQKSMGVITLALVTHHVIAKPDVPTWVKLACAAAMALGTAAGGWRIIRTMGHKIMRLEPVNGFAAETAGATVILLASKYGMPVSTTHVLAGSIFGVGASKSKHSVRWVIAQRMVIAWVLTIPAAAAVGAVSYSILSVLGI